MINDLDITNFYEEYLKIIKKIIEIQGNYALL
jgi:hypothetical protein